MGAKFSQFAKKTRSGRLSLYGNTTEEPKCGPAGYRIKDDADLTLLTPTPQNGQIRSNNWLAVAEEFFDFV